MINAHVSPSQPATQARLESLQQYFMTHGLPDPGAAAHRAMIAIGEIIRAQATVMGYSDCFGLLGVILVCAAVSVAFLKKGTAAAGGAH